MLARAVTHALVGLEPRRVEVEAHVSNMGTPVFVIVGLPDRACAEARQRVKAGIRSAELEFPRKVTVNLAPAGLRKEGSGYDLPIALAVPGASCWQVGLPRQLLSQSRVAGAPSESRR